ncbi:Uncharacterised protein [Niallia circulans]|jgi:hypothetical protein|nr:hypothetical protein [Shouchella clausii]MCM3549398.1 hypothetical protein [Shouchella clausii]SPU22406.1 Uncharacterised protein [Niallia circulans]
MDVFSAVAPVITVSAFAVSAIAFTYAKTQDEKIKSLEQRIEQLEKKPFG